MASIELTPVTPDAADRLSGAICKYAKGKMNVDTVYATALQHYGLEQALTALTMFLAGIQLDSSLEKHRASYSGPTMPGIDAALQDALARKLGFRS